MAKVVVVKEERLDRDKEKKLFLKQEEKTNRHRSTCSFFLLIKERQIPTTRS